MKKEKTKRGRGRPRKVAPEIKEKKRTALVEPSQPVEDSPKGIITEDEILKKAASIRATGEELPEEEQTEIEPGQQLEADLLAADEQSPEDAAGSNSERPNTGSPAQGDVIAQMENSMVLAPLEEGLGLQKGFLIMTEADQNLLAMVRPDDLEIKKSPEGYWTVFSLLNVSKFMKWFIWNWRQKKAARQKAAEEKAKREQQQQDEELTRGHAAGK